MIQISFFSFSQGNVLHKRITVSFENASINEALSKISQQIDYYFTFDASILKNQENLNFSFINIPLDSCLYQILEDSSLKFKLIGNHIVINKLLDQSTDNQLHKNSIIPFFNFSGLILDADSKKPLEYAIIGIKGSNKGSISNAQGAFILKITGNALEDTLVVNLMGYKALYYPIHLVKDSIQTLYLSRNYISLQEVIIRNNEPKSILRAALKKIPLNYSLKANYLIGFYREYVKKASEFMFYSEAVLKIYKTGYTNKNQADQIKILKSRKIKNISNTDTVRLKLKSGLQSVLILDIVKNMIDFLDENNFQFYNYRMVDIDSYFGKPVYVIEFKQKEFVQEALYEGQIYVDIESLAIVLANFGINRNKIKKAQNKFIIKKDRRLKLYLKQADYSVSYREINGRYYLSHVLGELKVKVKKKRELFATKFETSMELSVNEIDTLNVVKFKHKEADKLNTVFIDEVNDYDEDFWGEYNFIKPDDDWTEAIKKLKLKLEEQTGASF